MRDPEFTLSQDFAGLLAGLDERDDRVSADSDALAFTANGEHKALGARRGNANREIRYGVVSVEFAAVSPSACRLLTRVSLSFMGTRPKHRWNTTIGGTRWFIAGHLGAEWGTCDGRSQLKI
jgi:hypothetical protein